MGSYLAFSWELLWPRSLQHNRDPSFFGGEELKMSAEMSQHICCSCSRQCEGAPIPSCKGTFRATGAAARSLSSGRKGLRSGECHSSCVLTRSLLLDLGVMARVLLCRPSVRRGAR